MHAILLLSVCIRRTLNCFWNKIEVMSILTLMLMLMLVLKIIIIDDDDGADDDKHDVRSNSELWRPAPFFSCPYTIQCTVCFSNERMECQELVVWIQGKGSPKKGVYLPIKTAPLPGACGHETVRAELIQPQPYIDLNTTPQAKSLFLSGSLSTCFIIKGFDKRPSDVLRFGDTLITHQLLVTLSPRKAWGSCQ